MGPHRSRIPTLFLGDHSWNVCRWYLLDRIRRELIETSVQQFLCFFQNLITAKHHPQSWIIALFTSLCTWIIVLYTILSSTVNSCKAGYHYWAVLALEIFMVIFWLASMGALAATRATFIYPTTIDDCVNYGVGDSYCNKLRRRQYVASDGYLAMMSGAAGLSALEMFVSLHAPNH
jgi:hypothetical protein